MFRRLDRVELELESPTPPIVRLSAHLRRACKRVKIAIGPSLLAPVAVILGAMSIAWPALYNGFPLIYPDTLDYVQAGQNIKWTMLAHHRLSFYGDRSLIYSLTILPFHFHRTLWPIIALQCLLTAFILWRVFRSIVRRGTGLHFLVLMLLLSLFSSMSWFGSFAMPDILGPDLYLCIYLLVFARDTLSRAEQVAIYLFCWWAIASHASHLLVVLSLFFVLTLLAILQRKAMRNLKLAGELMGIVALALGAQITLNILLYGKTSVFGNRPPFLTARLIADGPGRWYLEKHCGELKWEMCKYVNNLSGSANRFLWSPDGVWMSATVESKKQIVREEMPLVTAILRTYPLEQLAQSAANFWSQLGTFGLWDAKSHPAITARINEVLPKAGLKYFESKQAHDQLPWRLFDTIQHCVVVTALVSIAAFLPWLWRYRPPRLIGLGLVIASTVVANALFTSTLSMVSPRFEARVIWLVPCFAALCALRWQATHSDESELALAEARQ